MWNLVQSRCAVMNIRNFGTNKVLRDGKSAPSSAGTPAGAPKSNGGENILRSMHHKPSDFDKKILVWMKKYPSVDQVPKYVPNDILQSAMSRARIRGCNYMFVIMGVAIIYTIVTSREEKKEKEKGLETTRDDYRSQITEEFRQQQLAGALAKK